MFDHLRIPVRETSTALDDVCTVFVSSYAIDRERKSPSGHAAVIHRTIGGQIVSKFTVSGGSPMGTDQREALIGTLRALQTIRRKCPDFKGLVLVFTDCPKLASQVAVARGVWQKNGWLNKDGKRIYNKSLWESLLGHLEGGNLRIAYAVIQMEILGADEADNLACIEALRFNNTLSPDVRRAAE